jgi:hypothetical protein
VHPRADSGKLTRYSPRHAAAKHRELSYRTRHPPGTLDRHLPVGPESLRRARSQPIGRSVRLLDTLAAGRRTVAQPGRHLRLSTTGRGLPGRTAARRRRTHSALGTWRTLPAASCHLPQRSGAFQPGKRTLQCAPWRNRHVAGRPMASRFTLRRRHSVPPSARRADHHCRPSAAVGMARTRAGFLRRDSRRTGSRRQ